MKKLKLLYIDFYMPHLLKDIDYPVGGAAVEWYAWIKGFFLNNQKVGVLTFKGARAYIDKILEFDIIESYSLNEGIRILRWLYKRFPAVYKAVSEYQPDFLIQECAGFDTGLMAYIGKKIKIPFIYRVANDMDTDERYKERLSKLQQVSYNFGLKHAYAIICQNNYQYERLKEKYPLKNMAIIHNPYFYEGELPAIQNQNERRYIAWLGVFQHQKNLPALLDIVENLKEVQFRIAGKSGNHLDEGTSNALSKLRDCDNVKFVGYLKRTEVIPFLSNAYALLNTSHYEGFSNTFLESFLAGTPVITTSKVDPDNIIYNNCLGFIAKDYNEIPNLIVSIIKSNDYNKIAQSCRQYVLKKHDPRILAQRFVEILNDLNKGLRRLEEK